MVRLFQVDFAFLIGSLCKNLAALPKKKNDGTKKNERSNCSTWFNNAYLLIHEQKIKETHGLIIFCYMGWMLYRMECSIIVRTNSQSEFWANGWTEYSILIRPKTFDFISSNSSNMDPINIKKHQYHFIFLLPPNSGLISATTHPTEMVHISIFVEFNKENN